MVNTCENLLSTEINQNFQTKMLTLLFLFDSTYSFKCKPIEINQTRVKSNKNIRLKDANLALKLGELLFPHASLSVNVALKHVPTCIFECGFSKIHPHSIFCEHRFSHVCTGGQKLVVGRMDLTHLLCL